MDRDQKRFRAAQQELAKLQEQAKQGELDLCYFDETGLNLLPHVPYAWQAKGQTTLLPARRDRGITILGVLNPLQQTFTGNYYQGAANSKCVVQVLDDFSRCLSRKTVLVLDNASIHHAKLVRSYHEQWKERGLYLYFIPPYSPELNKIEILWKQLKHFWLQTKHYTSMETLTNAACSILQRYGKDFSVSFL